MRFTPPPPPVKTHVDDWDWVDGLVEKELEEPKLKGDRCPHCCNEWHGFPRGFCAGSHFATRRWCPRINVSY
ncbi:hypothetical protein MINTM005_13720 [Mycobacterium intracellulare]|nr:hypothetical protein MINTM005_13720 [Mycobacterium intracellulare]